MELLFHLFGKRLKKSYFLCRGPTLKINHLIFGLTYQSLSHSFSIFLKFYLSFSVVLSKFFFILYQSFVSYFLVLSHSFFDLSHYFSFFLNLSQSFFLRSFSFFLRSFSVFLSSFSFFLRSFSFFFSRCYYFLVLSQSFLGSYSWLVCLSYCILLSFQMSNSKKIKTSLSEQIFKFLFVVQILQIYFILLKETSHFLYFSFVFYLTRKHLNCCCSLCVTKSGPKFNCFSKLGLGLDLYFIESSLVFFSVFFVLSFLKTTCFKDRHAIPKDSSANRIEYLVVDWTNSEPCNHFSNTSKHT